MKQFSELGIDKPSGPKFVGDSIEIYSIINTPIVVEHYEINNSKFQDKGNGKCLTVQIRINSTPRIIFTGSGVLMDTIVKIPAEGFPFETKIVKQDRSFIFT